MKLFHRALFALLIGGLGLGAAEPPARPEGWYAEVETSMGSFTFRLLSEQAPQTVAHFVAFATGQMEFVDTFTGNKKKAPFYDGLAIHKTKFAQWFEAGDPTGTGHGMPLVWVPAELGPVNFSRPYRVGMTASSMKRISGVMFFATIVAEPYFNSGHNCFGEIVEGRDVVDQICNVKINENGVPLQPVVIKHIKIVKSGEPKPLPAPVPYEPPVPTVGPSPAANP